MNARFAYLDYNATAPVRPEAARAVFEALQTCGNPSSIHTPGRAARQQVEAARSEVAALAGADASQVIFTSGGSEANQLALRGSQVTRVLVSAIEHDSVLAAMEQPTIIPVLESGVIDLMALKKMLTDAPQPALVSVMLANNETGILQPVAEAARIAHAHGAVLHCDAVQAAGKLAVDCEALGADLLSLSAHKIGGPQGIGALIVRNGLLLDAQLRGGGQERGLRAGTENVPGIIGFGVAANIARASLDQMARVMALRDQLEAGVAAIAPQTVFFGRDVARLPNTACFAQPGLSAATQVMALDLSGVAVSAGSACSSGKVSRSKVLRAMGAKDDLAASAIRISLGWGSQAEDVDAFLNAWENCMGGLYCGARVRESL